MSARNLKAAPGAPGAIPEIVERLTQEAEKVGERHGFTRAQLTHAVSALRQMAPSIDPRTLRSCPRCDGEMTVFAFDCSEDEAAALVGRDCLPQLPKRVKYSSEPRSVDVSRVRGGRMRVFMHIESTIPDSDPLAAFSPTAIRELAPEGPETAQAWKEHLHDQLKTIFGFATPSMVESQLRRPVYPSVMPPDGSSDISQAAIDAVNRRFRLRESDVQHLIALYSRLHGEMTQAMSDALDAAQVEPAAGKKALALRLIVDNTVRP